MLESPLLSCLGARVRSLDCNRRSQEDLSVLENSPCLRSGLSHLFKTKREGLSPPFQGG
jgi:hypothetical protein